MFVPEQNDIVNANNTFDLPIGLVAGLLYFILCVSGSLRVLPVDFSPLIQCLFQSKMSSWYRHACVEPVVLSPLLHIYAFPIFTRI